MLLVEHNQPRVVELSLFRVKSYLTTPSLMISQQLCHVLLLRCSVSWYLIEIVIQVNKLLRKWYYLKVLNLVVYPLFIV